MEIVEYLKELVNRANKKIPDDAVEGIVCTQEDASIQSPGVPAHYYRYFYFLCEELEPSIIVELGTNSGISALCFAAGNPHALVVTVNNQDELRPQCVRDNIRYEQQDSLEEIIGVDEGSVDILFIDTRHDGVQCLNEFNVHSKLVKPGGLIFFDDIYLLEEMKNFWNNFFPVGYEKMELPIHGWCGMGVLLKHEAQEA